MTVYDSTFACVVNHIAGVTTQLDEVQSVSITQGRQNLSDSYRSAVMTIEGRDPSSLPAIQIGDFIEVEIKAFNNGVAVALDPEVAFRTGRVTDLIIDYGIVPDMDTWTITTEDAIAILGRSVVSLTVNEGTVVSAAAKQITDAIGLTMTIDGVALSSTTVKQIVLDKANALDIFQKLANTEMAFVIQKGDELLWIPRYKWTDVAPTTTFTDDLSATGPSIHSFQALQSAGLADTSAQEVIISVVDGSTVSSGSGSTYIDFETYDVSSAQATDLANYIKALFTNPDPQPYQLDYLLNGQDPETVLDAVSLKLLEVSLDFRGLTYDSIVIGFKLTITPNVARASIQLLSVANLNFLILDSATLGILDVNVLSY